jgi:hypothetical protein
MLWLPTQFEREKKKKWYEKLETSRTLVAPCDARDHARCICESEQNVWVVVEQREGKSNLKYMVRGR